MAPSNVSSLTQPFPNKTSPAEDHSLSVEASTIERSEVKQVHNSGGTETAETAASPSKISETTCLNDFNATLDDTLAGATTSVESRRKEFLARFHAYVEAMALSDDPAGPGGINHPSYSAYNWDDEESFIQELENDQDILDGLTGDAVKKEWLLMLWRHHEDQPYLGSRWSDTSDSDEDDDENEWEENLEENKENVNEEKK